MSQELVNFRLDTDTKNKMREICEQLGLSMSTAFTIFAKAFVAHKGFPFDVVLEDDVFYSKENMTALEESIKQLKTGKTVAKDLSELDRMADK